MNQLKKALALLLAVLLCICALCACGGVSRRSSRDNKQSTSSGSLSSIPPVSSSPSDDIELSLVTPSFKEAMDQYEAFMDSYIEFTKKLGEDPSNTELLLQLNDYMEKYTAAMQALDEIDEDSLSPADEAYYLQVTMRVEKSSWRHPRRTDKRKDPASDRMQDPFR